MPAAKLTVPQGATLVGLLQSPSALDPFVNPQAAPGPAQPGAAEHGDQRQAEPRRRPRSIRHPRSGWPAATPPPAREGCATTSAAIRNAGFFCDYVVDWLQTQGSLDLSGHGPGHRNVRRLGGQHHRRHRQPRARAAYVGKVKDDQIGRLYTHDIRAAGVAFETRLPPDGPATGCSYILVTPDGERTMNTYLGAAQELMPDDIDAGQVAASAMLYLEGYLWDPEKRQGGLCEGFHHCA